MDDDDLAELAELRRRAYGPDPDIADDPAAGQRLAQLETSALASRFASDAPERMIEPAMPASPPTAAAPGTDAPPPAESTPMPRPGPGRPGMRRRRAWIVGAAVAAFGIGAAVAVAAFMGDEVLSAADPLPTALPASTYVIDRIAVTGPLGNSLEVPLAESWPAIPVVGEVDWASSLGDVLGWELWIYGVEAPGGRVHCLLLERHGILRHSCEAVAEAAQGSLHLDLPTEAVAVALRPPGIGHLDLQWRADGVVTVTAVAAG